MKVGVQQATPFPSVRNKYHCYTNIKKLAHIYETVKDSCSVRDRGRPRVSRDYAEHIIHLYTATQILIQYIRNIRIEY